MIPWVMIWAGGVMIYAGYKKTTPLAVIRSVLTNAPIPANTVGQNAPTPRATGSGQVPV